LFFHIKKTQIVILSVQKKPVLASLSISLLHQFKMTDVGLQQMILLKLANKILSLKIGMSMKKHFILLALLLLIISCGPSVNPALQQKITGYLSKSTDKIYKASSNFLKPMPYAIGQWVMHATTSEDKRSITKTSIVGKEQGGWIIETYSLNEYEETTAQMLITGLEQAAELHSLDYIEILWIKVKDKDGNIQNYESLALSLTKGLYKKALSGFDFDISSRLEGNTIVVPAGTFNGTYKITTDVPFLGKTIRSTGWYHSDVPINGLVKSISEEDNITMELLDFGTSGATRSF
jgi:hypothetical protein